MLRGLRTGDQRTLYLGAALVLVGWWRRPSARGRTLVYREELKPGRSLVVRYGRHGELADLEIAQARPAGDDRPHRKR